jgi:hypothetical protein
MLNMGDFGWARRIAATVPGATGAVNRSAVMTAMRGAKNTLRKLGIDNPRSKLDSILNWNTVPLIGTRT